MPLYNLNTTTITTTTTTTTTTTCTTTTTTTTTTYIPVVIVLMAFTYIEYLLQILECLLDMRADSFSRMGLPQTGQHDQWAYSPYVICSNRCVNLLESRKHLALSMLRGLLTCFLQCIYYKGTHISVHFFRKLLISNRFSLSSAENTINLVNCHGKKIINWILLIE